MKKQWLDGLNPEQAQACAHVDGPMLILAGAGSGKTTVLVARTGYLMDVAQVPPEQIGVVTFTNKAAKELRHRVRRKMDGPSVSGKKTDLMNSKEVWTGTFHRMGLEILRSWSDLAGLNKQFGIIDQSDSEGIVRDLLQNIKSSTKDEFHPGILLKTISALRENQDISSEVGPEYIEMGTALAPKYQSYLRQMGVVDFNELLLLPIQLIEKEQEVREKLQTRFKYLMIDEFQDTNALQLKLITLLTGRDGNLTVVGDDDQAIYGWRGANVQNILNFPRMFKDCKLIKLERNYRSTPQVLDIANAVIVKNQKRHDKILVTSNAAGDLPELFVYENEDVEVSRSIDEIHHFLQKGYKYEEIAILYRANSMGGLVEGELRKQKIPYTITGGQGLFEKKEVKDALAYLRSAIAPTELSFRRILNCPPRGIGEKTFEAICQHNGASTFLRARNYGEAHNHEGLQKLFADLVDFRESLEQVSVQNAATLFCSKMEQFGYWQYLLKHSKKIEGAKKKWQFIEILGRVFQSFCEESGTSRKSLREFVDFMELRDIDRDKEKKGIQLLTLHACKGLEFPVVLMVGLEEDILPHKTLGGDIDEERRLFYVGITRAQKRLVLSHCRQRQNRGRLQNVVASRFLSEIPEKAIQTYESGFRPVSSSQRNELVAQFFNKINQKIETEKR